MALVSCGPGSKTKNALRVGFNSWVGYSALYIAKKEGLFDGLGLDVTLTDSEKLPDRIAALGGGNFDVVGATVDSSVVTAAANVPGKIIFAFDSSRGADGIIAAPGIKSIADLKDKRIAVEEAFTDHFMLLKVLAQHGVGARDFNLVGLTADNGAVAFTRGAVDAAAIYEPYLSQATKRHGSHIIYTTKDEPPYIFDVLYAPDRVIASRRELLEKFLRALIKANDLWEKSPTSYQAFVAKSWDWKEPEVAAAVEEIQIATSQRQKEWFLPQNSPILTAADAAARLWLDSGVVKVSLNGAELVDASLVKSALASGDIGG
ncbi:MAG TPA: ABC transporter substrate-binding protein [Rhizomicrobium sp.]|nr:ABC transporter substrate-binding protein [Rhizomicrobium sp.]